MKLANVPVKSWVDIDSGFRAIRRLPPGLPRMMLVHGKPGLGKTTAVDWLSNKGHCVYAVCWPDWTPRTFLEALASRMGTRVGSRPRADQLRNAVLDDLESRQIEAIMLDEFDRVSHKRGVVEMVRALYDASDVPVILVGMDSIDRDLQAYPQFYDRIGENIAFQPVDLEDAAKVARALCEIGFAGDDGVTVPDVIRELHQRSSGILRQFVTQLAHLERNALRDGLASVGLEDLEGV